MKSVWAHLCHSWKYINGHNAFNLWLWHSAPLVPALIIRENRFIFTIIRACIQIRVNSKQIFICIILLKNYNILIINHKKCKYFQVFIFVVFIIQWPWHFNENQILKWYMTKFPWFAHGILIRVSIDSLITG